MVSAIDTASGQLFAACLGEASVRRLFEVDLKFKRQTGRRSACALGRPGGAQFDASALTELQAQCQARADGAVVVGVSALAAPVLDNRGQIVLALTAIGTLAALDTCWDGPQAALLRQAARTASALLGWQPHPTPSA